MENRFQISHSKQGFQSAQVINKNRMNYFIKHNHKGFTLIETLFAILIFSTALVSLMAISGKGIAAASSAREQTVAHYLAQEGLEVVRNMRDQNWLDQIPWDARFQDCLKDTPCKVDYQGNSVAPIVVSCGGGCPFVKESNGDFVDTGTDSSYARTIYVIPRDADTITNMPREYEIISAVVWKSKTIERTVTLKTILKEWQ